MTSQPRAFSHSTSLKSAYKQDVKRELIKRFNAEDWYGLGYFIQSWTKRCDDHEASDILLPMLERAEEQFRLARNKQPYHFVG